jgi:hypothetical protein
VVSHPEIESVKFYSLFGLSCGLAFVYFQLAISLLSLFAFMPWLLSKSPIMPAIRLASQKSYMGVMLLTQSSEFIKSSISGVAVFSKFLTLVG